MTETDANGHTVRVKQRSFDQVREVECHTQGLTRDVLGERGPLYCPSCGKPLEDAR